jgi:hypothetical protein
LFCFVLFFVEYISRAHQQEKKLTRFFVGPTTFAHQHDKHKNSKKSDERLKRSKQARKGSTQNVVRSRNWLRLACGTKPKRIRWEFWMRKGLLVGCGGALQPMGPLKKKKIKI